MSAAAEPIAPPPPRRFGVTPAIELAVLAVAIAILIASYFIITTDSESQRLLTPPIVALLLVSNLVPGVALLVLLGRRIAKRRAARTVGTEGRLHVRFVAMFSVLAAVPMVLVTVFASLLFQYGVEFWFSDRARGMLENASSLARENYQTELNRVNRETTTMAGDLRFYLTQWPIDSPNFAQGISLQVFRRELSEALIVQVTPGREIQALALVNPYERQLDRVITPKMIAALQGGRQSVVVRSNDRIGVVTALDASQNTYMYAARVFEPELASQLRRGATILADYRALIDRSRVLQLQFNIILLVLSLAIVGIAVIVALQLADRLVRPVNELVDAAQAIAGGDLSARVAIPRSNDEVGTLATAFNRMTVRLQEQTNALVAANAQSEGRRVLIEAVMSGVSAGVLSINEDRRIRVINSSATALLRTGEESPVGRPLAEVAPELDALLDTPARESVIQLSTGGEARTLAVKITRDEDGQVLTFDDITQQLLDQRRAAWSDVARRIAHEIKNPLTPIQLAAERLKRRYWKQVEGSDDGTFTKLTDTIVRQVGDLRRMVDEFSSFARMPKPVFREESLIDMARQAMFLHEVAHPAITFRLDIGDGNAPLVCDRRQIGQALTNIVKNAVEAVEARAKDAPAGEINASIMHDDANHLRMEIADNGIGLPVERDRIVEPYMTTRAGGTGLGLAIVKRIVEEHHGTITFADRPGGGTVVTLAFDTAALARLLDGNTGDTGEGAEPGPAMLTRTHG